MKVKGSIVDLGKLSEPITALINRAADAGSVIYEPTRIVRKAKAEAKADKVRTLSDVEVKDIRLRAQLRIEQEQISDQRNIETIAGKAMGMLNEDAKPNEIDLDWLRNFFDKCRLTSDEDIQMLWAKILASEANQNNSFNKRTVFAVSQLSKREALKFSQLCRCLCSIIDDTPDMFVFVEKLEASPKGGLSFVDINHLSMIGLTTISSSGYSKMCDTDKPILFYFGESYKIEVCSKNRELFIGQVLLSEIGRELANICDVEPMPNFVSNLEAVWLKKNQIKSLKKI